jgi:hypothetical protein
LSEPFLRSSRPPSPAPSSPCSWTSVSSWRPLPLRPGPEVIGPEVRERVLQGNTILLINTFQEMKLFSLNVMSIFGEKEMRYIEELKQCYLSLEKGFHSMTVSQSGTLFHEAMKALKRLGAIVDHISQYQREQP